MDAITAALIGVIGVLVAGGFVWLRSEIIPRFDRMDQRFDRMDQRFDRMDQRFDHMDELLRSQGERIARVEGREEAVAGG